MLAASALFAYAIVMLVLAMGLRVVTRRRHTHSEVVLGDVKRDLHAIVAAIDGIPKLHVTKVDPWGIHVRRNLSDILILVQLRQREPTEMDVTVTVRISGLGGGRYRTFITQVMQAIYSAQERHGRPPSPFGPTAPS